jgi:hypothetical protein
MTPEVQAQVDEAVAAWLNYEFDAQEMVGFPLKSAPPVFRHSRTAREWESSWGYNVPYADVMKDECQAVLDGDLPLTTIGDYEFSRRPDGMYNLGCFVLNPVQAQALLDQTP